MLKIGITGVIGAGKTNVCRLFANYGAGVVDADNLAHHVLRNPQVVLSLTEAFGAKILDVGTNQIDRQKLALHAFATPEAVSLLEQVTHPEIANQVVLAFAQLQLSGFRLSVFDAPLLFETSADCLVETTVCVVCDAEVIAKRSARPADRRLAMIEQRRKRQFTQAEKQTRADHIIDNSGSEASTSQQVKQLFDRLMTTTHRH